MSEHPVPDIQTDDLPRSERIPGVVLAAVILLYVGAGLFALNALASLITGYWSTLSVLVRGVGYPLFALLYVFLAFKVQHRHRWAWLAVLVLCALGAALAVIRLVLNPTAVNVGQLAWPIVYGILLLLKPSRDWFRTAPPDPAA